MRFRFFVLVGMVVGCSASDDGANWGTGGTAAGSTGMGGAATGGTATGGARVDVSAACAAGQALCNGFCVSIQTDPANCGSCGRVCATGQSCAAGACTCTAGLTDCSGSCVNLTSDAANCGACGSSCPAGLVCSLGQCNATCAANLTLCGSGCTDTNTDVAHCGACGQACQPGMACVSGSCTCSAGQTLCGSTCTSTSTDPAHCGSCGAACSNGASCVGGQCTGGTGSGGTGSGGSPSGGSSGVSTGGVGTGGVSTGGAATGGVATGGVATGGEATGGVATGGEATGGVATGGEATGGMATGGESTGGTSTGGQTSALTKFVGNITTRNAVPSDFVNYWDQITPENEGKWGSVEGTRDNMNWAGLDRAYDYAQQNNIIFKQHTFVWGSQQPSWANNNSDMADEVREWMQLYCQRYPNTALIDVVNEPPPHTTPAYSQAIGGSGSSGWDWIVNAFTWAREACPNAILILNDYNNLEWSGDAANFISIANAVKNAGAPMDALGCQAHGVYSRTNSEITGFLNDLKAVGLPLYITEYDIPETNDQTQLDILQTQFPLFYEDPDIKGITLWGYIYGSTWVTGSGLIRDGSFRPAMTWLMDYLGR